MAKATKAAAPKKKAAAPKKTETSDDKTLYLTINDDADLLRFVALYIVMHSCVDVVKRMTDDGSPTDELAEVVSAVTRHDGDYTKAALEYHDLYDMEKYNADAGVPDSALEAFSCLTAEQQAGWWDVGRAIKLIMMARSLDPGARINR